ncbi:MAG: biotin-dependent carboxyltransferase family protein [Solobacterium sp.]|nr:biotin-dependent carboxyltransferase family protein [Solobacterium sp.]
MFVKVKQAGALTTIQDAGRYGYQELGIPVAGAMDQAAMKTANILVGNEMDAPVLECIGFGPVLEFSGPVCFAVSGGEFRVLLNEVPLEMNRAYRAEEGDILKVTNSVKHRSCCIAFSGKIIAEEKAGSYATDIKSGLGGYSGRKLRAGDMIGIAAPAKTLPNMKKRVTASYLKDEDIHVLRVTEGPNEEAFTEKGLRTFYSSVYTVSPKSDRMGFRLDGAAIETVKGNDILSAGITDGAVQVTPAQPVLMMKDHAATGGYAVIAVVISADLPQASQLLPGDRIRFEKVSVEEAEKLIQAQNEKLRELHRKLDKRILGLF